MRAAQALAAIALLACAAAAWEVLDDEAPLPSHDEVRRRQVDDPLHVQWGNLRVRLEPHEVHQSHISRIISHYHSKALKHPEWIHPRADAMAWRANNDNITCNTEHINHVHNDELEQIRRHLRERGVPPDYQPHPLAQSQHHHDARGPIDRSGYQPVRIWFDTSRLNGIGADTDPRVCYTTGGSITTVSTCSSLVCGTDDLTTVAFQNALKNSVIPAAISVLASVVNVKPVVGNLVLDSPYYTATSGICGGTTPSCGANLAVPASWATAGQGVGANMDFAMIAVARPVGSSGGPLAYAGPCNYVTNGVSGGYYITERPLLGHVDFNPRTWVSYDLSSPMNFNEAVRVVCHEMLHAMGFLGSLMSSYLNPATGVTYSPAQPTQYTVTGPVQGALWFITLPTILNDARTHYGCATLEGMVLENEQTSSPPSHWEKRVAFFDVMAPVSTDLSVFSSLTIELIDSMGWWSGTASAAEEHLWGKGLGCNWVGSRGMPAGYPGCTASSWNYPGYWCSDSNAPTQCRADRGGWGPCYFSTSLSLTSYYQNFPSNPTWGGIFSLADACPAFGVYSNRICHDASATQGSWSCTLGEERCPTCRCFECGTGCPTTQLCFDQRCSGGVFQIYINSVWVSCPAAGGVISTGVGAATIVCPKYTDMCDIPVVRPATQTKRTCTGSTYLWTEPVPSSASPTPAATPSQTGTPSGTPSVSPTSTVSKSLSSSGTGTGTPSITASPSNTPTSSQSGTPSNSPTPSNTPSLTPSITPTGTATQTPSNTASPSKSLSAGATGTPSGTPSTSLSSTPTTSPTASITASPSNTPTTSPSGTPSNSPSSSNTPTRTPTQTGTASITASPSATQTSTQTPSNSPAATPSQTPTNSPTSSRSLSPTATNTASSTVTPSVSPTGTQTPSVTPSPGSSASNTPSITPTPSITATPTGTGSATAAATPSASASASPTQTGTQTPTGSNTRTPSSSATPAATGTPSVSSSQSATPTSSETPSSSSSATPPPTIGTSPTSTGSVTASPSPSGTRTATAAPSISLSNTPTLSSGSTASPSPSAQASASMPASVSSSTGSTASPTAAASSSSASTGASASPTAVPSSSSSIGSSPSRSAAAASASPSAGAGGTGSQSASVAATPAATSSPTPATPTECNQLISLRFVNTTTAQVSASDILAAASAITARPESDFSVTGLQASGNDVVAELHTIIVDTSQCDAIIADIVSSPSTDPGAWNPTVPQISSTSNPNGGGGGGGSSGFPTYAYYIIAGAGGLLILCFLALVVLAVLIVGVLIIVKVVGKSGGSSGKSHTHRLDDNILYSGGF